MPLLSDELLLRCEAMLKTPVRNVQMIGGGDINEARLLSTDHGDFFLKYNTHPQALAMLEAEWKGLEHIHTTQVIATPGLIACGSEASTAYLLMNFIPTASPDQKAWEQFGHSLARLHQTSQEQFGWEHDNYIGRLPQSNQLHHSWATFYQQERLEPQVKMAIDQQRMDVHLVAHFERLYQRLEEICPAEPPALIHGDLWSGNFLINQQGKAVLIDPAVCYAHREMDLAMSLLFGGFSSAFYAGYQAQYPTIGNLQDRIEIYQLYYLLVHVNLFGGSYVNAVKRTIQRF